MRRQNINFIDCETANKNNYNSQLAAHSTVECFKVLRTWHKKFYCLPHEAHSSAHILFKWTFKRSEESSMEQFHRKASICCNRLIVCMHFSSILPLFSIRFSPDLFSRFLLAFRNAPLLINEFLFSIRNTCKFSTSFYELGRMFSMDESKDERMLN